MTLVERARVFSFAAHQAVGQVRKYTGEPYWNHPARVVEILKGVEHTEAMLAAAYLHDTVEDTEMTLEDIFAEFGATVTMVVQQLTNTPKTPENNRAQRKEMDRERLGKALPQVQTVKVADMIDNTRDVMEHDEKFAAVYFEECRALLDVLTVADPILVSRLREVIG
jgi:guanosine-3',5'-bis(diphosphate) 3'-pyrophosphohydrolase